MYYTTASVTPGRVPKSCCHASSVLSFSCLSLKQQPVETPRTCRCAAWSDLSRRAKALREIKVQKWSAGEPGSAGLESSTRAKGARPRKGGQRERERRKKQRRRKEEGDDREVRSGRMIGDIQGCDQALLHGKSGPLRLM